MECDVVKKVTALLITSCFLHGCASKGFYKPANINEKTGLYDTGSSLEQSDIYKYDTNVDIKKFKLVVLDAQSDLFRNRFEFFVRNSLSEIGVKMIFNKEELSNFVKINPKINSKEAILQDIDDSINIRKISNVIGPILYIKISSNVNGAGRRNIKLDIFDIETDSLLFSAAKDKVIWEDFDKEINYPIMNKMKEWFKQSMYKKA